MIETEIRTHGGIHIGRMVWGEGTWMERQECDTEGECVVDGEIDIVGPVCVCLFVGGGDVYVGEFVCCCETATAGGGDGW